MNASQRTARRAEDRAEVETRMKALAILIVTSEQDGAYPDGLPDDLRRVLQVGLTFGPDLPRPPLPGAE